MERQHRNSTPWTWLVGVLLVGSASLVIAPASARGDTLQPLISLGPTSVQNGVATVAATVAGEPSATANVTINGQPVAVNAGGEINANVNLNGQSSLEIGVTNPQTGERSTINIPLTSNLLGAGGQLAENALVPLQQAGISFVRPPDGFQSSDGQPLQLAGRVLDSSQLSGLSVNGVEVLRLLGPGGSFTAPASGSSREVVFTATDKQGVSQTNVYPVTQVSSLIKTAAGTSVSAMGAKGLRIAKIRYITTGVRASKQIRAAITIRGSAGVPGSGRDHSAVQPEAGSHQRRHAVQAVQPPWHRQLHSAPPAEGLREALLHRGDGEDAVGEGEKGELGRPAASARGQALRVLQPRRVPSHPEAAPLPPLILRRR